MQEAPTDKTLTQNIHEEHRDHKQKAHIMTHTGDTTLMAESEEELKSFLMKAKG